jgi:methyl halide transferase
MIFYRGGDAPFLSGGAMTDQPNPGRYAGTDRPEHWDALYQQGDTGWDLGGPAPAFVDLLAGPDAPPPGRMLALGSGRGHDALLFAEHGFDVLGIDFAPSAVAEATAAAEARGLSERARFEQRDIFALPPSYREAFDYVLEHTCFAAIDPRLNEEYAALVPRLLRPGGLYLALFFAHGRPGGPPYATTIDAVREQFAPRLEILRLETAQHSVPSRAGRELFAMMRKPPGPIEGPPEVQ